MAVDFGSSNGSSADRFYEMPINSLLDMKSGVGWTMIMLGKMPTVGTYPYYWLSTGNYAATNSVNLFSSSSDGSMNASIGNVDAISGYIPPLNKWFVLAAGKTKTDRVYASGCTVGRHDASWNLNYNAPAPLSQQVNTLKIGKRNDSSDTRYWPGQIGELVYVNKELTGDEVRMLANGVPIRSFDWYKTAKIHLRFRSPNDRYILDGNNGGMATRNGTGYPVTSSGDGMTNFDALTDSSIYDGTMYVPGEVVSPPDPPDPPVPGDGYCSISVRRRRRRK